MPWTATWELSAGDGFNDQPVTDNLDQAFRERKHAMQANGTPTVLGTYHTTGDVLQNASTYAAVQTYVDAGDLAGSHLGGVVPNFVKPTINFAADAAPDDHTTWRWTIDTWRAASTIHADGWDAQYARTITDLSDTAYPDGDAFTDGDKALHVSEGRIYQYATGVWTLLGNVGTHKPTVKTTQRVTAAGDYLTRKSLNEIYRGYDRLRWLSYTTAISAPYIGGLDAGPAGSFADGINRGSESIDNWADAKTNAETNYLTNTVSAGRGATLAECSSSGILTTYLDGLGDPVTSYSAYLFDRWSTFTTTQPGGFDLDWQTVFLVRVDDVPRTGGNDEVPGGRRIFDANGCDVVYHVWHKFDLTGPANATQTSVRLGKVGPAYQPVWCDEPTATPVDGDPVYDMTSRGWSCVEDYTGVAAILQFDVAGGFDMVT